VLKKLKMSEAGGRVPKKTPEISISGTSQPFEWSRFAVRRDQRGRGEKKKTKDKTTEECEKRTEEKQEEEEEKRNYTYKRCLSNAGRGSERQPSSL
jgi:hypothetical protein